MVARDYHAEMDRSDSRVELVERFFNGTGDSYDFMVNAATLGIDRLWKRAILARMPSHPKRVLDLACGTGISTLAIARRFPECQVVGVELRQEYLTLARRKIERLGINNVHLVLSRAEDYRSDERFDCITSSYLAKYADLGVITSLSGDLLVDDGTLIMHDFTYPPKRYLVPFWRIYFFMLQHLGTPFFPAWKEIYYGLPEIIERSRWLEDLREALDRYGFTDARADYLTAYGSAIVSARKGATHARA